MKYKLKQMESTLDIREEFDILKLRKVNFTLGRDILKNRLEELRKQRGIKQEDLASELEVSRQTIGSLENGRYNPSIILAFKIARYFDMSIEEIFIYEEE
jgi:putative transcriptional regulator